MVIMEDGNTQEAKQRNFEKIKSFFDRIGFTLLMNDWRKVEKGDGAMAIIGVENWGKVPFKQYGDLSKAMKGTENIPFKILLSHDPTHWDEEVQGKTAIDLTFSGHLHGFQFGFEMGTIKWSPVQYMYSKWAGIYQTGRQYLYINRGFGYIGFPGRVGILPEITLLELNSKTVNT